MRWDGQWPIIFGRSGDIDVIGKFSSHLQQALDVGMVRIDDERATILSPPVPEELADDDWLALLSAATEVGHELERLGYQVSY